MSRILLGWEMGRNWGHLSRLHPLATRLQAHGNKVVMVVRDIASAAALFDPADISFLPSPVHTGASQGVEQPVSYADLLFSQGWGDPSALWGLVQGWINLYELFRPDVVVLDYSPTAQLAARMLGIRCVGVGSGFTVPPATDPLPPFPNCPWATTERAVEAERRVLESVRVVMAALHARPLQSLRELFECERQMLTTFRELDPYGARPEAHYVGPLGTGAQGQHVDWPERSSRPKVLAYLRPHMQDLAAILDALAICEATVVAYGPGIPERLLDRVRGPHRRFSARPIHFDRLFKDADACLSYAPAATVAHSLLHGVPQILLPAHVEAHLTARRVEALGAGVVLHGRQTCASAAAILNHVLTQSQFRAHAREFSIRYSHHDPARAADHVVTQIEAIAREGSTDELAERARMRSSALAAGRT